MILTRYCSPGQTCRMLDISPSLLKKFANDGKIGYFELPSGQRRYSVDDLIPRKPEEPRNEVQQHVDPVPYMLRSAKYRARYKGVDFNLEPEDISIPERCPVFDIPIAPFLGAGNPACATIDRVNPNKVYVKGNVKVISMKANRLKSNCANPAELRAIADYIEANT